MEGKEIRLLITHSIAALGLVPHRDFESRIVPASARRVNKLRQSYPASRASTWVRH